MLTSAIVWLSISPSLYYQLQKFVSVRVRERPTRPRLIIGRSVTVIHNVNHVVVTERVVPVTQCTTQTSWDLYCAICHEASCVWLPGDAYVFDWKTYPGATGLLGRLSTLRAPSSHNRYDLGLHVWRNLGSDIHREGETPSLAWCFMNQSWY